MHQTNEIRYHFITNLTIKKFIGIHIIYIGIGAIFSLTPIHMKKFKKSAQRP